MTTHAIRKHIEVCDVTETDETIVIDYWKFQYPGDQVRRQSKSLIIDRKHNTHLMQFVDGMVSQWDAINIVVQHEMDCRWKQTYDMAFNANPENN